MVYKFFHALEIQSERREKKNDLKIMMRRGKGLENISTVVFSAVAMFSAPWSAIASAPRSVKER